jgi:hypothetical protein
MSATNVLLHPSPVQLLDGPVPKNALSGGHMTRLGPRSHDTDIAESFEENDLSIFTPLKRPIDDLIPLPLHEIEPASTLGRSTIIPRSPNTTTKKR